MMEKERHLFNQDVSIVDNDRLTQLIIADAQEANLDAVTADVSLRDSVELIEFHRRIQHYQSDELLVPGIILKTLAAANDKEERRNKPSQFSSLDELVSKRGVAAVRLDSLKSYNLTRTEQVLVLRSVIIATTARDMAARKEGSRLSERQLKIQRTALYGLRSLATNHVPVPQDMSEENIQRFRLNYTTNYIARAVLQETMIQRGISLSSTSIDDALNLPILYGALSSGDQSSVVSIFPPGEAMEEENENTGRFRQIHPAEIDEERIERLRQMQTNFGNEYTTFRYYESIQPFQPSTGNGRPKNEGVDSEPDQDSNSEDRNASYLVLEIEHPGEDDVYRTHVVADNPQVKNACYALRQEVLEEWERITGVGLVWRDVFTLSRGVARQMGARAFHHNKGSDVPKRVRQYLNQERQSLVLETFGAIFDRGEKELFDDDMNPTERNKMPKIIIDKIQASQTLRAMWPSIRQNGYSQAHRLQTASQKSGKIITQEAVRERKKKWKDLAADYFNSLLEED